MKIEQSRWQHVLPASDPGIWSDAARNLSYVNGKSIAQTRRHKGKYIPQTFLMRFTLLGGEGAAFHTLPNSYPIRNAVVLAGAARDSMLKSAGISRSNLESYQTELRLHHQCGVTEANYLLPGNSSAAGFNADAAFGKDVVYDYTSVTYTDSGGEHTKQMVVLGATAVPADGTCYEAVNNWISYRRSFTPPTDDNDISPDNLVSRIMQQSDTAKGIITELADEQDEKPYNLDDFKLAEMFTIALLPSNSGVNHVTLEVPLGLYWLDAELEKSSIVDVEVLGVRDM